MRYHTQLLFFTVLFFCFTSCSSPKKQYSLPKNASALLAGTSGKTWKIAWRYNEGTRMNMAGCFLSYRITYKPDMIIKDNNGEQGNCGPSLIANWEIAKNKTGDSYIKWTGDQLPELFNNKEDYKYFKILQITKDTLKLQHRHKQFSSSSIFVDTYVTENIKVKDRAFHR